MKRLNPSLILAFVLIASGLPISFVRAELPKAPIDYNLQVRPILSNACFQCHGPDADERQGELRLDDRDAALAPAESGKPAIVPGNADASALVKRIFATKASVVMPPLKSHKTLTDAEKQLLKEWVAQGAALPGPLVVPNPQTSRPPRRSGPIVAPQFDRSVHSGQAGQRGPETDT